MKRKWTFKIIFLVCVIFLYCPYGYSRSYSSYSFSYPQTSKPHENNWTYIGSIIAWDPLGEKPTDRGIRQIEIIIKDQKNKKVLNDQFELDSALIDKQITWGDFETLTIEIFERGNEYANDEYNRHLLEKGPRHLVTLKYIWDGEKFVKQK